MDDISSDKIEKISYQRISNYFGSDDSTLSTDLNISYSSTSMSKTRYSKPSNNNLYNNRRFFSRKK